MKFSNPSKPSTAASMSRPKDEPIKPPIDIKPKKEEVKPPAKEELKQLVKEPLPPISSSNLFYDSIVVRTTRKIAASA